MGYSIGKFSRLTGISVDSLRHYERCGLLSPTVNPDNGYRVYTDADAVRAYTIKMYRGLNMPIPEIEQSFRDGSFKHTRCWLESHMADLEAEITRLQLLRACYQKSLYNIESAMREKDAVMELKLPPACHLYYDDCEDEELMRRWTQSVPFVTYMFRLDREDILAGRKVVPRLGLGALLHIVEEFGLPITPPARLYTGGKGLRMRSCTRDLFAIGRKELAPLLEYARQNGLEMADDAVYLVDAVEVGAFGPVFHVDIHFQVQAARS